MNPRDNHPRRWYDFSALIAAELVAIGKPKGIRQKQIAEAIGVKEPQMSLYVKGTRGIMTTGHLVAACELLDVQPRDVVEAAYAKLLRADGAPATVTPIRPDGPMSDPVENMPIAARHDDDDAEAAAQQDGA